MDNGPHETETDVVVAHNFVKKDLSQNLKSRPLGHSAAENQNISRSSMPQKRLNHSLIPQY